MNRILVIGLDGATWNLIKPWAEEGKLPNFRRLLSTSTWGNLESTIPPASPPAWTSLFTGKSPAKHGIYSFVKEKKDSYFITPISSRDRKAEPIWGLLNKAGKGTILINIPFTYPPDEVRGIMISGLGTPSRNSNFTYPKSFKKKLLSKYPGYDVDFNEDLLLHSSDRTPFLKAMKEITGEQMRLVKELIKKREWDFFAYVVRSLDPVQHYFWEQKEIILAYYQQADDFLGWILDNLKKEDVLAICSDHGFGRVESRVYINNWLESKGLFVMGKEGLYSFKGSSALTERILSWLITKGGKGLIWRLKRSKILEVVLKFIPALNVASLLKIDWQKTSAYFLEGSGGMININLKNRQPRGIVKKEDYEVVRERIIREVKELTDPRDGRPVILDARRAEEIYGCRTPEMPDIILFKDERYFPKGFNSRGKIFQKIEKRKGEHTKEGIFLFYGHNVKKSQKIEGVRIYDLFPTFLDILGIPLPQGLDGKVLKEVFR